MNKKRQLMMLLALNSLAVTYADTNNTLKLDRMYNSITKNLDVGKSNDKTYKLLQKALNDRNKDLKDLYLQGDYIVKPEYLEWQVFFTGFYNSSKKKDNTMENALYYSTPKTSTDSNKIEGNLYNQIISSGVGDKTLFAILDGDMNLYSSLNEDQKYLVDKLINSSEATEGNFKPYGKAQDYKIVDLGISIDIKGVDREISDLNIPGIKVASVNTNVSNFEKPDSLTIPNVDITSFNPVIPNITTINFNPVPILNLNGTGGGNSGVTGFFPYGDQGGNNSIISQMDIISGTVSVTTSINEDWGDNDPGYYSYTLDNVVGNPSAGLEYSELYEYDPITGDYTIEPAYIPSGVYSNSILGNPTGSIQHTQAIFKVIDNSITRLGVNGSNPNDFKVILEGDVVDPEYLVQVLHYDEHYMGVFDPDVGYMKYTLSGMEEKGWITTAEKIELGTKYLEEALGHTADNRDFQYVENNGTWYLKGSNIVGVNLQAHGGYDEAHAVFNNRGEIIGLNEASTRYNLIGKQVAFMFTEGDVYRKHEYFDNTGLIELRAPESVVFLMTSNASSYGYSYYGSNTSESEDFISGKHVLMNNGDMKIYGNSSIGVYTNAAPTPYYYTNERYNLNGTWSKSISNAGALKGSEIRFNTPLTVLGDQSIGIDIERELNFADSKIKVDVGTEDPRQNVANSLGVNGLENSGNIAGGDAGYTDGSAGIYLNMSGNIAYTSNYIYDCRSGTCMATSNYWDNIESPEVELVDYLINVGSYSKGGAGIRVEEHGDLILGSSSDVDRANEINLLAGGINNAGIYIAGASAQVRTDGLVMNIDGTSQVGAQAEDFGRFFHNNGIINVNGTGNTGIAIKSTSLGEISNTGVINVGAGNLGVYNASMFNMNGGNINVNGLASVGVYSESGMAVTSLNLGTIRAEQGGIALYAGTGSIMNLGEGFNLISGKNGLLFYNYDGTTVSGRYDLSGNVTATIENGGNAFYLKGGSSITDYLNDSFTGSGQLELTMESGSKLYILEGLGMSLSLSSLDGMVNPGSMLANNVIISSASANDYIPLSMNKGALIIDRDISLDNNNDLYKRSEFSSVSVSLDSGKNITGTGEGQLGIAQRNYEGSTGISAINILNNGIIDLNGLNSVGITVDYGHVTNNNLIRTVGSKSIGIYSTNGSTAENNGEIRIGGENTAGIYGANFLDGVTSASSLRYGTDKINIQNNGNIISEGTSKVYGIYADNIALGTGDSVVNLGTGSNIDLSSAKGSVGVYANNTTVTGGGILTIGSDSLGMYLKDSNVNLNNLTLNMAGDNSLGFYLDGTTNFAGTGIINVSGKNIALFNVSSDGTFNNDFTVTATSDSSYVVGNVNNGTFRYTGTGNIGSNGSLVNGKNSAVLIDTTGVVNGSGTNVIGIALEGQYTGTLPLGYTLGIDGENKGLISLGDSSAGLYGKNGSRLQNTGIIRVGNDSFGLSSTGTGSLLRNEGTIELGSTSIGMYGEESDFIENTGSGVLRSNSSEAVGVYLTGTGTQSVINDGLLELSGDKSRGIYIKGAGSKTVTNNGSIVIGDSTNVNNPGIGIYADTIGNVINNMGNIVSGRNSVGIYTQDGTVNQNGAIKTGDTGIGIYGDNAQINLNAGSLLDLGNNGSIGVYALNNTNVSSNGDMRIGTGSYGYALKSGSMLTNSSNVTLEGAGIFAYGDGSGLITNTGTVTMNGSDNIGFYGINGGIVNNSGTIVGTSGKSNIGIYNKDGNIANSGNISVGDSVILSLDDTSQNRYSIGIYGDKSDIYNTGNINVGYYGVGIYGSGNKVENYGEVTSSSLGAIGLFIENGQLENYGNITLTGDNSIGIYANKGSKVTNHGVITMGGNTSQGIYLNLASEVENKGIININGNDSQGILLKGNGKLVNGTGGTINLAGGLTGSEAIADGTTSPYPIPEIINAGVINVSENFEVDGIKVSIKVDPSTITQATINEDLGALFVSDAVKFNAPSFSTTDPVEIMSGFAVGTHAEVYKLKDVFNPTTPDGGPNSGIVKVRSKSLTWEATPVVNERGNVDIWMKKIPYDNFTRGLWYEDFGLALDSKYVGSTNNMGLIFDKIDTIETEPDFRRTISSLAGDLYSNINQREETITDIFTESLKTLQNSKNNTKENVKISIIAGKGKLEDGTDGVVGYDYTTTGALALREVERTYKHTFGYSLGYGYVGYQFKDGSNSKERSDSINLGLHNKYSVNGWTLRNSLLGQVSFREMERNVKWTNAEDSQMKSNYEVYSLINENRLGKELELGKNVSITPYGGLRTAYVTRGSFSEEGLEKLEVEGRDAWSVKPKAGVELVSTVDIGSTGNWKLKSSLDVSYEYELGDLHKREKAKLLNVETENHKLSKPGEEKGQLRSVAQIGVEVEDRYGIFVTGEYKVRDKGQEDYRAGVTLKAVF